MIEPLGPRVQSFLILVYASIRTRLIPNQTDKVISVMIAVDENSDELAVPLRVLARDEIRHCTISAVPFWWRDAPPATGSQELPPETADVLVIGSGFTGLSAALVLERSACWANARR